MPSVQANGLTLAYEETGDPGAPAVVMVMGLAVQLIFWPDELCAMLVDRGLRVIRFDNRDIGLSTKLDHLGTPNVVLESIKHALHLPVAAPYLIDDMAKDTEGFLDALGLERVHLVGASMGGMIVQNVAARAPHRVASLISIMSTTGRRSLPPPRPRALRALLRPPPPPGDLVAARERMKFVLRLIGSRTHPAPEDWLHAFCERHVRRSYHPAGALRQLVAIAGSGDRTEVVRRIRAPTLVMHGDEDPLLRPECGRATAIAIHEGGGDARLMMVKGMGHDLPLPLLPSIADAIASHCHTGDRPAFA